jgi:hypothetical protein
MSTLTSRTKIVATATAVATAVALSASVALAAESDAQQPAHQTLLFDATITQVHAEGPPPNEVGHLETASGVLADRRRRAVGRFHFICRWIQSPKDGNAGESCSGWGRTADGRFAVAGSADANSPDRSWTVTGRTGSYRGAIGSVFVRNVGFAGRESVLVLTLSARSGVTLRVAVIPRPQANTRFVVRVNAACSDARAKIARLPRFPVQHFDPLDPDPGLLPEVGRFFSGPATHGRSSTPSGVSWPHSAGRRPTARRGRAS